DERTALEQLIERSPACARAYVELGESLEQEGQHARARAVFERGLRAVPGDAVLHGMLAASCWELGERDAALSAIERAWLLDTSYAFALESRIRWLADLGRGAEAVAFAQQAAATAPRWPHAHEALALAMQLAGRHDERIAALARAVELAPRSE